MVTYVPPSLRNRNKENQNSDTHDKAKAAGLQDVSQDNHVTSDRPHIVSHDDTMHGSPTRKRVKDGNSISGKHAQVASRAENDDIVVTNEVEEGAVDPGVVSLLRTTESSPLPTAEEPLPTASAAHTKQDTTQRTTNDTPTSSVSLIDSLPPTKDSTNMALQDELRSITAYMYREWPTAMRNPEALAMVGRMANASREGSLDDLYSLQGELVAFLFTQAQPRSHH